MPLDSPGGRHDGRSVNTQSVVGIVILIFLVLGVSGWWYLRHRDAGTPDTVRNGGGRIPPPPPPGTRPAVRICGSNTVGAELAPALVTEFLKSRGATDARTQTRKPDEVEVSAQLPNQSSRTAFEIRAHGTGTAFIGLAAAKDEERCEVGMASRKVNAKELELTSQSGLGNLDAPGVENVLGLDGIAVIVNKGNRPVQTLSTEQVANIFSGAVSDWSQVGGRPGPIAVFARDEKSGTWDTFQALVLKDKKLIGTATRIEDSRELSERVSHDERAIGFIGLPYVLDAHAVGISDVGTSPVFPTRYSIAGETYALT